MKQGFLTRITTPDGSDEDTLYIYTDEDISDLYDNITRETLIDTLDEERVEYSVIFPERVEELELEVTED